MARLISVDGFEFIVMQSSSRMPNSCWGHYKHSAVVRVDPGGSIPGCIRDTRTATVLWDSGPGFSGKTSRCAAERDYDRAIDLAREWCANRTARVNAERTAGYLDSLAERGLD